MRCSRPLARPRRLRPLRAAAVTATIPVGSRPYAVAANPLTGTVYLANFASDNVSVIANATCATTVTGTHSGPPTIGPGTTCVEPGAVITGPVTITAGGAALIQGATLQGPLQANHAAGLAVCGTTIDGAVSIVNATGPVVLGGGAGSGCAPDTLGGAVALTGNTTGVVLAGNTIGGAVALTRNTTEVVVAGNTISGSLSCNGNDPAPADNGQPNTVTGLASGQCSALA